MPILKPFDVEERAKEILRAPKSEVASDNPRERGKLALDNAGASIEDAAEELAQVLKSEEDSGKRLKAIEMVMKMHDVLVNDNKASVPVVSINIIGSDRTLVNLVTPFS